MIDFDFAFTPAEYRSELIGQPVEALRSLAAGLRAVVRDDTHTLAEMLGWLEGLLEDRDNVATGAEKPSVLAGLRVEHDQAAARLAELKAQLAKCNGEAYRDCWLDSTQNSAGKNYTRLRWFKSDGRKGCRTLKPDEVGEATRAVELWAEHDQAAAQLERVNSQIRGVELRVERLVG